MPRIVDRRTGRDPGSFTEEECTQLMALFDEPTRHKEPTPIDLDVVERFVESGASERLVVVLEQILQGREDFDIGIEPDLP